MERVVMVALGWKLFVGLKLNLNPIYYIKNSISVMLIC